ncbi:MAG: sigma-70 family RNA polymerase sigma factor [Chloroflexi bacterium]|nr:sigma-70 family RNA polymerase sigma factor [Chloroflexota bacterium]
MSDEQFIQAARRGDLDAFNRLVLEYEGLVYNVALRLLSDPGLAEDATQDAFVSAFRNLGRFRGGSFKAWLLRIVKNASYDELRRQGRRPIVALESEGEDGQTLDSPEWLADPGESPEELAERVELGEAIQRCIEQLDVEFRAAIILVDIQGFDYAQAADTLEAPLGTIKSRLARARIGVQECLQSVEELLPQAMRLKREQ